MSIAYPTKRQSAPAASLLGCLLLAAGAGSGSFAGEASSAAADVAFVQPFIGETTALVAKIDLARLSLPDLSDRIKSAAPGSEEAFRTRTRDAAAWIEALRTATGGQAVYVTVGIPLSMTERPVFLVLKETPRADRKKLVDRLSVILEMESIAREGVIVAIPGRNVSVASALGTLRPTPREGLVDAFKAVEEYPIQVLLVPPDYVRRTVTELMPRLPRQLGGGPSNVLTEGLVWAALGVDLAQLRARLVVRAASEEAARRLAEHLPKMLRSAFETLPGFQQRIPSEAFASLLALPAPRVDGDRLVVRVEGAEPAGDASRLLTLAAAALRDRIVRQSNFEKFKQILLAMHNYHDTHKVFPPRDEERGPGKLSWRVHLLPLLEQRALYEEFRLEEPWDSAHNKRLIEKMPEVYRNRSVIVAPGRTTFLAPVGEDTVFGAEKATKIGEITDGTSNTLVLVEVKPQLAVPWTAPQDYAFDPKAPERGLQIGADGRFLAGLADGSALTLRGDVGPELLLRLFRKSDGKPVDLRTYRQGSPAGLAP